MKVPVENLLGKKNQGFRVIVHNFNHELSEGRACICAARPPPTLCPHTRGALTPAVPLHLLCHAPVHNAATNMHAIPHPTVLPTRALPCSGSGVNAGADASDDHMSGRLVVP